MTYKSFAIAGVGTLGTHVLTALLEKEVSVVVLTRVGSEGKTFPKGVKVVPVDYGDVSSLAKTLQDNAVEVLISTVGTPDAYAAQKGYADAAKLAGVKLFVPSEFGVPTEGAQGGMWGTKSEVQAHSKSIGLPLALFYTGFFLDFLPWIASIGESKKFNIVSKGETPVSFTALSDIGGYVSHVLTTLAAAKLSNHSFHLQGDRATLAELGERSGLEVVVSESIPENISAAPIKNLLLKAAEKGIASTGWDWAKGKDVAEDAGKDNKLWEGHKWVTAKDLFGY